MAVLLAAFVVSLGMPALAGPGAGPAQIHDATGDWAVASADIVSVHFSVVGPSRHRSVRVHLTAAAPPSNGQPVTYTVSFAAPDCEAAALVVDWSGGVPAVVDSGYLDRSGCADRAALVRQSRLEEVPYLADASGITWTVGIDAVGGAGAELTKLTASTRVGGRVTADGATSDALLPVGDEAQGRSWTVPR
jgi:hypothetical protein